MTLTTAQHSSLVLPLNNLSLPFSPITQALLTMGCRVVTCR